MAVQHWKYPSGHTAIGWAWALLLSEVSPAQQDALLARGIAFGHSRVICGAHWRSDVIAGSLIGASVVAKLHSNAVFLALLCSLSQLLRPYGVQMQARVFPSARLRRIARHRYRRIYE